MSLPYFPINEAYLIGTWCAGVVWGAYTIVIGTVLYLTYVNYSQTRKFQHKTSITLVTIIWILATAHLSISLRRLLEAFIFLPPDFPLGSIGYLADISQPLNRSKDMLYITVLWLSDLIIVWRCWVVWGRNWLVTALPILMVLGTAISGYGAIGQYWITDVTEESVAVSVQWGTAMFAVSLATNSLVTLLTASRIWLITRNSNIISNGTSRTRSALLLLIESGAFVFAIKLIEFVLFELSPDDGINGLNALYIVFEVIPQVIGLVPTLIVLTVTARVAIGDSITARLGNGSGTGSYNGPLAFGRSSGATSTLASTQVKVHRAHETMSGHVMKSFTPSDLESGMDPKLSYHRS